MEAWLIESAKAVGRFFLNPLLYWSFILVVLSGYQRIKRERANFGTKIFDVFSEWKNTWKTAVLSGLFLSVVTLGSGMVFSYEMIMLLSVVVIILSLTLRFTMLSASYTIGITYVLLLFLPYLLKSQSYVEVDLFSQTSFTSLTVLLGLLLLVEAALMRRTRRNETYPKLAMGDRGIWTGQHLVKKVSIIPFFTLLPTGMITPFADYWPYFSLGGDTYSLILVPFLIGFHYKVTGHLPYQVIKKLANAITWLGVIVLCIAAASIFLPWLSLAAVLVAIIGREFINYKQRMKDRENRTYFLQAKKGLKILGIIPKTPADRLNILVGETLVKVNGKKISEPRELYQALQDSGAFLKLEIVDDAGEKRFVQGAFYQGEHHELGLIFARPPISKK